MPSVSSPIRVMVASSDAQLMAAVAPALAAAQGVRLVGKAGTGEQVRQFVRQRHPTLLIVDLALPPAGGLAVLGGVKRRSPKTKLLTIDEELHERRALRTAKAGAHGYMLAEAIPAYLAKAVRCMAAGEAWFSRRLTAKIVDEFHRLIRLQARAGPHRGRRGALRGR